MDHGLIPISKLCYHVPSSKRIKCLSLVVAFWSTKFKIERGCTVKDKKVEIENRTRFVILLLDFILQPCLPYYSSNFIWVWSGYYCKNRLVFSFWIMYFVHYSSHMRIPFETWNSWCDFPPEIKGICFLKNSPFHLFDHACLLSCTASVGDQIKTTKMKQNWYLTFPFHPETYEMGSHGVSYNFRDHFQPNQYIFQKSNGSYCVI